METDTGVGASGGAGRLGRRFTAAEEAVSAPIGSGAPVDPAWSRESAADNTVSGAARAG
jgi:hypothetical protein